MTVNLTSLLVLTTLFISTSDKLPRTSYIKLMDLWHLANICIPFIEVLLHTAINNEIYNQAVKTKVRIGKKKI